MRLLLPYLSALLCATLLHSPAWAAQATVAVAANFAEPIKAIAELLQKSTGHTVQITLGSTGKLYAQIRNGAPFDVLLAADARTPQRLEAEGQAVAGSRYLGALAEDDQLARLDGVAAVAELDQQVHLVRIVRAATRRQPRQADVARDAADLHDAVG